MNGFLLQKELEVSELVKKGYDVGEVQEDDSSTITFGDYQAKGFVEGGYLYNVYNINQKGTFEVVASLIDNFGTVFLPDSEEYIEAIMTRAAAPKEELDEMDKQFADKLKPYLDEKFTEYDIKVNQ